MKQYHKNIQQDIKNFKKLIAEIKALEAEIERIKKACYTYLSHHKAELDEIFLRDETK